jgi:hypothetical protein
MSFLAAIKSLFGMKPSAPVLKGPNDKMLKCLDCKNEFVFDEGEQKFFETKGFTPPKRCPTCRKKVRGRMRRRGRGGAGREASSNHNGGGNNNNHSHGRRNSYGRRRSVIDGDSPYAD